MLLEFTCNVREDKLLKIINNKYPEISYNKLNSLLRKKDIRINGIKVSENVNVRQNDAIQIYISNFENKKNISINIFYKDKNILIAEKPQNIEVEGTNSLTELLKPDYSYLKPCHRLDRNTIGLTVFALNETAYNEILSAFNKRNIEKYYLTLLCGNLENKETTLNAFLFKDSKKARVYVSNKPDKGFMPITTAYKVLDQFNDLSLAEIHLITGRTHQIRAHMAFIGHPVLGDGKYGLNEFNKRFDTDTQQLYAYKIKFKLPDNSPLKYLNECEFENKLYINDLQEFNLFTNYEIKKVLVNYDINKPVQDFDNSKLNGYIIENESAELKNNINTVMSGQKSLETALNNSNSAKNHNNNNNNNKNIKNLNRSSNNSNSQQVQNKNQHNNKPATTNNNNSKSSSHNEQEKKLNSNNNNNNPNRNNNQVQNNLTSNTNTNTNTNNNSNRSKNKKRRKKKINTNTEIVKANI